MPEIVADRYRLDRELGRTRMSEVWLAHDLELDRPVALKLLAPSADTARFEREAIAVAALNDPNVTLLYDFGQTAERPFMVFEYLSGGTLEERLAAEGRLADDETQRIAEDIAAGLAHAHARGVVHRDLKPANVLFDPDGRAKLADFGIARLAAGTGTLTDAGTVMGTASYISPEQAAGRPAGPASDVYSFGAVLFRMLTGRLPFESDDRLELLRLHRDADPPPVSTVRADAPPVLAGAVDAMLARDPALRPRDGAAVVELLRGGGGTTAATRVIPPPPPRRRRGATLAAVLVALAAAGGALAWELTKPAATVPPATTSRQPMRPATSRPVTTEPAIVPTTTAAPTTSSTPTTTHHVSTSTAPATTTRPATTSTHAATTTAQTTPTTTAIPTTSTIPPATTTEPATTTTTTTTATTTTPGP
jgi:eukaryotic-like serine/threonine-protein kinase